MPICIMLQDCTQLLTIFTEYLHCMEMAVSTIALAERGVKQN